MEQSLSHWGIYEVEKPKRYEYRESAALGKYQGSIEYQLIQNAANAVYQKNNFGKLD